MSLPDQPSYAWAPATKEPTPVPPRRGRTGLVIGVAVAVVVVVGVLVAVGVAGARLLRPTDATPGTAAAAPTSTPEPTAAPEPTPTKYVGTLQALAIPMPAGATRQTLRMGAKDGTLDLEAVLLEYEAKDRSTMRSILTEMGFERGLFLAWNDKQGVGIYLQIYQFNLERNAAAWTASEMRLFDSEAVSTAAFDDILGGKWFKMTPVNGRIPIHARYAKGDFAVMLSTFSKTKADVDYLKRLAVDQLHKLP